nr:hypothetical protein [Paenibacillus lemnae]
MHLLNTFMPESMWTSLTGLKRCAGVIDDNLKLERQMIFQKWIKGPNGWKCVGMELSMPSDEPPSPLNMLSFHNSSQPPGLEPVTAGRMLQMIIWSQFEKITLLHPFLGGEPFFTNEEMETVSTYLVPTYLSPHPLKELGKEFKIKHLASGIPLYQEKIPAPPLVMDAENGRLSGVWMTGVHVNEGGFAGLRPYLKVPKGERTYMKAQIV